MTLTASYYSVSMFVGCVDVRLAIRFVVKPNDMLVVGLSASVIVAMSIVGRFMVIGIVKGLMSVVCSRIVVRMVVAAAVVRIGVIVLVLVLFGSAR